MHFPRVTGNTADPTPNALRAANALEGTVEEFYEDWLGAAFTTPKSIVRPFAAEACIVREAEVYGGAVGLANNTLVPAFHACYAVVFTTRWDSRTSKKRTSVDEEREGKGQPLSYGGGKKGKGEGKHASGSSDWASGEAGGKGSSKRAGSSEGNHSQWKERKLESKGPSASSKGTGKGKRSQGKGTSGK